MKKKLFLLVSLLTAGALVACSGGGIDVDSLINGGGDDTSSDGGEGGGGDTIRLDGTADEAINKFYRLAQTQGFEITYTSSSTDESNNPVQDSTTVGLKNNIFWVKESVAYQKVDNNLELYNYDASKAYYEYNNVTPETAQTSLQIIVKTFTQSFYQGYGLLEDTQAGYLSAKKSLTYLNREATEYTFAYRGLEGVMDSKIIFDNETGITLKISASVAVATSGDSSGYFEVTSFKVGNAVTLPTLHKTNSGGEGGEGGEGGGGTEQNKFTGHVFTSSGSKLTLFEDGTFEYVVQVRGVLVYIGEYSVSKDGATVVLRVKKKYDGTSYTAVAMTWSFSYAEDKYVLKEADGSEVDFSIVESATPTHENLPDDTGGQGGQGGEGGDTDARFKVSAELWESVVTDCNYVTPNSNYSVRVTTSDNQRGYTQYQFDSGKVRVYTVDPDGVANESYYVRTSDIKGLEYYQDEFGAWVNRESFTGLGSYNESIGLRHAIPFSAVTYNSDTHEYECRSWTNQYGNTFTNISIGFVDNKLAKISFVNPSWDVRFESEFMNYGRTTVTIPELGGGTLTPEQLNDIVRGKVFVFDTATSGAGVVYTNSNFFAGDYITFFSEGDFEFIRHKKVNYVDNTATDVVSCYSGTYQVQEDTDKDGVNDILLVVTKIVEGSYELEDYVSGSMTISGTIKGEFNLLTIPENNGSIKVNYGWDYSQSPTHYEIPEDEPEGAKWPADAIAEYFAQKQYKTALPSLAMEGFTYEFKDGVITMIPNEEHIADDIVANARSILENKGFKLVYLDNEGWLQDFYVDANKQYLIHFMGDNGNAVATITEVNGVLAESLYLSYPREALNNTLPREVDESLPMLEVSGATYILGDSGVGYMLVISLPGKMEASQVMPNLVRKLSSYVAEDEETYTSPGGKIVLNITSQDERVIIIEINYVYDVTYTFVTRQDWIFNDEAKLYAHVWDDDGHTDWIELTKVNNTTLTLTISHNWTGCKLVRFAKDSTIAWQNEGGTIYSETDDIKLGGATASFTFEMHDPNQKALIKNKNGPIGSFFSFDFLA